MRILVRDLKKIAGKQVNERDLKELARDLNSIRNFRQADDVLEEADQILGTFGVEAVYAEDDPIKPAAIYLNVGDTYSNTIIYDVLEDEVLYTSLGDWIEAVESDGIRIK